MDNKKTIGFYEVSLDNTSVEVTMLGYPLYRKYYKRVNTAVKHFEQIAEDIEYVVKEQLFWRCTGYNKIKVFLVDTLDGSKHEYVSAYNKETAILLAKEYHPNKVFDPKNIWTCS
ncbi:hypothetical protein VF04_04060 [Nostoc linckia z7]|uniref:Phage protein n=2 Tax=Nostoc linckia TaxID=92942 RepID=A0A9Q6EN22_NOSLI|nr:hypothetical protein [Nostoc linckia]PHK42888.1 hypothetical protein VF12_00760 [Nostoc linckia z15]PHK48045.1 hypothetical protein VF13_01735 [Nostoc linckia z16]PHJ64965.1 hypothetical protein VF02_11545 [Nostoc linckia z1]PHJ70143.1 hypothetical protein VF05_11705 [Nostoc linckia z3]PHJ75044.1 hypothetical protein VF03_11865 [Nostoc linckia z2]